MTTLSFEHVSFSYGDRLVLDRVDWQVQAHEFWALIGPNGGGKTTLLKLALGLLTPQNGQVRVMNQPVSEGRVHLGYVPQFATFRRDFPLSVKETVMHGRLGLRNWWSAMNSSDKHAIEQAMRATGVLDLADRPISQLSGGQMQRVLIARALATAPQVLLLDEPTAHVDTGSERELFDLLARLRESMSIILVSHDVGLVSQHVDHIACIHQTLECHPAGGVASDSFQRLYGMPVTLVDHHHHDHHGQHSHSHHHAHDHAHDHHPHTNGGRS